MSQRFIAKKRNDSFVPNPNMLRQSIIELRGIYPELSEDEYCIWYQNRYGVKQAEVKKILGSVEHE